jgi:hypothetical protein
MNSSKLQTYGCHLKDEADEPISVILDKEGFSMCTFDNKIDIVPSI